MCPYVKKSGGRPLGEKNKKLLSKVSKKEKIFLKNDQEGSKTRA